MTKYIIDIEEVCDCGNCPMNYDYVNCTIFNGLASENPVRQ